MFKVQYTEMCHFDLIDTFDVYLFIIMGEIKKFWKKNHKWDPAYISVVVF